MLFRVLRLARVHGLIGGSTDRQGTIRWANNALSSVLRSDHPNSVRDFVEFQGGEMVQAWQGLLPTLRSGKPAWQASHPGSPDAGAASPDFWSYIKEKPEVEELFSRAMETSDSLSRRVLLTDYRWGDFSRYLDVGGAYGSLLAALLQEHPGSSGVLFDLPQVIQRAEAVWREKRPKLAGRAQLVGGSFFDKGAIPAARNSSDVYILRVVLHDWHDDEALAILKNVRAAIGDSNATLALIEITPDDGLRENMEGRLAMDIQMLVCCDGRERGKADWQALFRQSGFHLKGVIPMRGFFKVVEAVPV